MKTTLINIPIWIGIYYLAMSFVSVDFNPFNWEMSVRMLMIVLALASIFITHIFFELND